MHVPILKVVFLVLCVVQISFSQRSSVEGRYLRPSPQDRPCASSVRCPEAGRDRYRDDKYPDDYKDQDNVRPPVRKDEEWPKADTRPGGYSDYKPEVSPGRYDEGDYKTKPSSGGTDHDVDNPRDVFRPKPKDDYLPKPVESEIIRKPAVYGTKPDEYDTKEDEYKPKPNVRDDYVSKPLVRDDYNPRPIDKDDYNSRPVDKEDYNKPQGGGGGYHYPKPAREETKEDIPPYKPSAGGGHYDVKDESLNDDDGDIGKPAPVIENNNCICVPYYQCKDGHIVTDGGGIIDARSRPQLDEDLPHEFKPPSCGAFDVCCNTPESFTVKPYEHRCGVRNPSGINSRILSPSNKGEADFGEWPWQAAVLKSEGTVNIFQCGGVLIDKYHVLTVAHCVFHVYKYNDYPLKVRLGEWDTQTTSEFLAHEDYKVSKITIHPEFRNTSLWNDIAILRLQEPVLFAPHIDSICLPKYDESFSGQNCVVTGWGKDSYKGGTFSNVMKEVALQVIDNYSCEEMLRKTRLGRFFQLHEGFVCAGGEHGLDSCKGDGGGPLVCYRKDKSYALAGLVSWGIDCGQPGVPGVYVKVQKYLDWISKNTGVDLQDYWPRA